LLLSDSKLTRVLQEALGGRCKTVIIATVSPSITAIEESVSTLNYAHSANGIVNNPISSSLIAFGEKMPSFDRPGFDSNTDSKVPAITVESWQEMEMRLQYMQTQVDEAQAALARKHIAWKRQSQICWRVNKSCTMLIKRYYH
jgi:kinesin family protein 11